MSSTCISYSANYDTVQSYFAAEYSTSLSYRLEKIYQAAWVYISWRLE